MAVTRITPGGGVTCSPPPPAHDVDLSPHIHLSDATHLWCSYQMKLQTIIPISSTYSPIPQNNKDIILIIPCPIPTKYLYPILSTYTPYQPRLYPGEGGYSLKIFKNTGSGTLTTPPPSPIFFGTPKIKENFLSTICYLSRMQTYPKMSVPVSTKV